MLRAIVRASDCSRDHEVFLDNHVLQRKSGRYWLGKGALCIGIERTNLQSFLFLVPHERHAIFPDP